MTLATTETDFTLDKCKTGRSVLTATPVPLLVL